MLVGAVNDCVALGNAEKKPSFLQLMKQTNEVAVPFILLTVLVRYLGLKHCFSPKVFFGHFCL